MITPRCLLACVCCLHLFASFCFLSNCFLSNNALCEKLSPLSNIQAQSLELNEKGVQALKTKDLKLAEKYFREAVEADRSNTTAAFNLGGILISLKKEPEAIEFLSHYVKDYTKDPGLYVRLGDASFASKNLKAALEAYERGFELDSSYPGLLSKLGTIYGLSSRLQDAERMYLLAVEQNPKDAKALSSLSSIFLGNGQPEKAISTAKRALQVKANSEVYVTLGTAYEILKDYKNSLIAFQRATDLGDRRPELQKKIDSLKKVAS